MKNENKEIKYIGVVSDGITDPKIEQAYYEALYNANSSTGNFRDSLGYRKLKQAMYEVQREKSEELAKRFKSKNIKPDDLIVVE